MNKCWSKLAFFNLLLGKYPKERRAYVYKITCTRVFLADILSVVPNWKQPKYLLTEWIKYHMHTMKHSIVMKKDKLLIHSIGRHLRDSAEVKEVRHKGGTWCESSYPFPKNQAKLRGWMDFAHRRNWLRGAPGSLLGNSKCSVILILVMVYTDVHIGKNSLGCTPKICALCYGIPSLKVLKRWQQFENYRSAQVPVSLCIRRRMPVESLSSVSCVLE